MCSILDFLFELLSQNSDSQEKNSDPQLQFTLDKSIPFVLSREEKREIEFLVRGFFILRSGSDESPLLLNDESGPLLTEFCFIMSTLHLFPEHRVGELVEMFLKVADRDGYLPKPLVTGDDLKAMGVPPSPRMGELLKAVYMAQIRGEVSSRSEAMTWVERSLGEL